MNMNKKLYALIAGLAGVVLCVALMLFSCGGDKGPSTTEPTLGDAESVATDVTGQVTEEPTEETTEETEESTEETTEPEETTAPTTASGGSSPGGTGGFQGGTTPTVPTTPTEPSEKEELIVAEPGSAELPYAESIADLPDTRSSVEIPGGKTASYQLFVTEDAVLTIKDADAYVIYGDKTYESKEGVVTVTIPKGNVPVSLKIGNKAAAAKAFDLSADYPLGSQNRPEAIDTIDQIQLQLGGNLGAVRYYVWTASEYGKLTMKAEGAKIDMTITSTNANGVTKVVTGTTTEDGTTIDVEPTDEVVICISITPADATTDVLVTGTFEATLGSATNPIAIPDVSVPVEIQVEPGKTTYYAGRSAGMVLTIGDAQGLSLVYGGKTIQADEKGVITLTFPAASGMGPAALEVFGLSIDGEEAKSFILTFSYAVGHPQNPAELVMGENTATIAADNADGYNYVWTAPGDGKLTITMTSQSWQYMIINETAGVYGDICDSSLEPSVATTVLEVAQGDQIALNVNGFDPEDPWSYPGGTVVFTALYEELVGTEENPIWITDLSKPFPVEVPANTSLYLTGRIFDVPMTIENASGASVMLDNVTYGANESGLLTVNFPASQSMGRPQPVVFVLTNGTNVDAVYTLNFHYPVGSPQNPDQLVIGDNAAQLEANNTDGYTYNWTATSDGKLTITMLDETWQYTMSNITTGVYGDRHMSEDDPVVASQTIEVTSGDLVEIIVNTFTPGTYETPAGTVSFTADLESDLGSESNPIPIVDDNLEDGGIITFTTASQTAGKKVHYSFRAPGFDLVITGEGAFTATYDGTVYTAENGSLTVPKFMAKDMYNPAVVIIEGAGVFKMRMEPPVGVLDNPAPLNVDDYMGNQVTLEAGAEAYYYGYTAEEDGVLTVNAYASENPNGFQISVYNLTSYQMSEILDQTVGESMSVDMKAGETVQVIVNTYNAEDPFSPTPAGTVLFGASYQPPVGTEENPVLILDENMDDGNVITFTTGTHTAGEPLHYAMGRAPGYDLVITGDGDFTAVYDGTTYTSNNGKLVVPAFKSADMYATAGLILEGTGIFHFRMEPPVGSVANPVALNVTDAKGNVAEVAAGTEGYYFLFASEAAGKLTLTAEAADNAAGYQINGTSLITYAASETIDQTTGSTLEIDVVAGDQIRIAVNTFNSADVYNTPAGKIVFTAVFTPAPAAQSVQEFQGTTTPTAPFQLTLGEGQVLNYLDLTKTEAYALVLDSATGYYHLDSISGPVVYVNLGTAQDNPAPYLSLKALMEANAAFGAAGESYNACLKQYIACADVQTGLYPLTEDLAYMLRSGGDELGWWNPSDPDYLFRTMDQEGKILNPLNGWLFACCVIG